PFSDDFQFWLGVITYNSGTDELIHEADYVHHRTSLLLQFTAQKNSEENHFEEELEQMEDLEPIDIPHAVGCSGSMTSDYGDVYHTFTAQTDDVDYTFSRKKFHLKQFDVELARSLGESLKTEEEGAYTPFYERFALDEHTFHFPMFHKDFVNHVEVSITDIGQVELSWTNDVFLRYNVGEEESEFTYIIRHTNRFADNIDYTEIESLETENGNTVTAYESDRLDNVTYVWEH